MRIPPFNEAGELPLGEHVTSLAAVKRRFGRSSAQRQKLMRGLEAAVENLRAAGVRRLWIDGSFVTRKQAPNDVDGCWEYSDEVDLEALDPVFLLESRGPMKIKYGIEFFLPLRLKLTAACRFRPSSKSIETGSLREFW
jgi:hypothetical protein